MNGGVTRRDGLGLALVALAGLMFAFAVGMPGVSPFALFETPWDWQARAFLQLQLPRVVLGFAAGMVLSTAGVAMQAMLRNPLADPYILGVSGGAAVGAATVALAGTLVGGGAVAAVIEPVGGFVGALGAFVIVFAFGRGGGQAGPMRMLLAGIAVNAFAGACLMVFAALGDAGSVQRTLVRLMGVVSADPSLPLLAPLVIVIAVIGVLFTWPARAALNVLILGDETALSVGVDAHALRRKLLIVLSLAVGAVVAATGLIGFVGLVVPHALRLGLGPDHRRLLPFAAIVGGVVVMVADAGVSGLAGALGSELPVGVITAIIGGPLFLWLLARHFRAGFTA